MDKEVYSKLELEVVEFECDDVIDDSPFGPFDPYSDDQEPGA